MSAATDTTVATPAPELREIRGPSAFGGEWRRFWHLLWLMSVTDYRTRYVNSVLGYLWTLLRPLLFFGVIVVVMRQIIRFGGGIENYVEMLLLNLMLFQFFSDATGRAVKSVASSENLVRKMQFPRITIPLSVVLSAAFTTLTNMIAVFALLIALGLDPRWTWLLIPVIVLALLLFITGISLTLSAAYVRFRDVQQFWNVISRTLFYATPILYLIELVPESFRTIVASNPLSPIFEQARIWIIDADAPTITEAAGGAAYLLIPLAIFLGLGAFGVWIFDREAPRVAEQL